MTVKEFLLTTDALNLTSIAKKMYPTNKAAASYLNRKLQGTDGRSFTDKDAGLAIIVLKSLVKDIEDINNVKI